MLVKQVAKESNKVDLIVAQSLLGVVLLWPAGHFSSVCAPDSFKEGTVCSHLTCRELILLACYKCHNAVGLQPECPQTRAVVCSANTSVWFKIDS